MGEGGGEYELEFGPAALLPGAPGAGFLESVVKFAGEPAIRVELVALLSKAGPVFTCDLRPVHHCGYYLSTPSCKRCKVELPAWESLPLRLPLNGTDLMQRSLEAWVEVLWATEPLETALRASYLLTAIRDYTDSMRGELLTYAQREKARFIENYPFNYSENGYADALERFCLKAKMRGESLELRS